MEKTEKKNVRTLRGVVVSDAMDKTIVVKVDRYVKDRKYGKYHKISKRFKAHDGENAAKVGDKVEIRECPPISKDKKFKVVK